MKTQKTGGGEMSRPSSDVKIGNSSKRKIIIACAPLLATVLNAPIEAAHTAKWCMANQGNRSWDDTWWCCENYNKGYTSWGAIDCFTSPANGCANAESSCTFDW